MDLIMFIVSLVMLVFFLVCGVQFRCGKWIGLFFKQTVKVKKHPSKKKGDPRKEERARKREEQRRLAVGAKLSNVVLFAAFATFLQLLSFVFMKMQFEPWGALLFGVTFICYIGVFVLLVTTMRKVSKM